MPGRSHLTGLTDDDIVVILWDMMAGGIDTSATSMVLPPVAALSPQSRREPSLCGTMSLRRFTRARCDGTASLRYGLVLFQEILIYLLINFPDVQKKVHAELDAVVGDKRSETHCGTHAHAHAQRW
jgi:hypothetical protein